MKWQTSMLALCLCTSALAQQQQDTSWLRDMPTVTDVTKGIQGASPAQTLGRQCAALERLWRGRDFPAAYMFNPTPAMKARQAEYQKGIGELRQRYESSVKALDTEDNKREWNRMCSNARSGIHPVTGKRDKAFPALDEPVSDAEWLALLKPAARAAVDRERASRGQATRRQQAALGAAKLRAEERLQQDRLQAMRLAGLAAGLLLFALASFAWMTGSLARTTWKPSSDGRQLRVRSKLWDVRTTGGVVLSARKDLETIVSGSGGGGPNNAPVTVSISSRTVVHWDIRLDCGDGQQQSVRLRNWNISAEPGDRLHLFQASRKRIQTPYLLICNRSTGEYWYNGDSLHPHLVPARAGRALLLVLATAAALGFVAFAVFSVMGFLTAPSGMGSYEDDYMRLTVVATAGTAIATCVAGFLWMWRGGKKAQRCIDEIIAWLRNLPQPAIGMN